jgi:hypothetical protein
VPARPPWIAALLRRDEGNLARVRRIGDVDNVNAVVLAGHDAPRAEEGVVAVGRDADVGDPLRHNVLEPKLAHQVDVLVRGRQMAGRVAVLVGVALLVPRSHAAVSGDELGR